VDYVLRPRPLGVRRRASTLIDVDLAPAQRAAVTLPPGRHLLVLGEAGHGKTTVALHRIAHLWRQAPPSARACLVVPTEGLERWLQPLLRRLGADVEVKAYERWAREQARGVFPDLPDRESEDAAAAAARLKRHPALLRAIDDIAARRGRARARRSDLLHLFGDRVLLEAVAASAAGAIPSQTVDEVLEHTHVQFSRTAEQEWSHVTDRRRLEAVDRLALDVGTASGDARTVDTEDYAVLFEIDRRRAERRGRTPASPPLYDLLAIDEAQELAPIELALLGRSLAPEGTLVVAGDAAQQIDPSVTFEGWAATMRALGCIEHATVTLEVGYRCPPGVVAVARHVLGGGEPTPPADSVPQPRFGDGAELARWIARELAALARRDRTATNAVICRGPIFARRLAEQLRSHVGARLVLDGSFLVRGGVQVTTVDQVKGLEFDTVIVPDATAEAYPDEPAARRALYVAVTRARHQLVLASAGKRTPLLATG
jgi:hypothetical protein